jgi:hypothetical protein
MQTMREAAQRHRRRSQGAPAKLVQNGLMSVQVATGESAGCRGASCTGVPEPPTSHAPAVGGAEAVWAHFPRVYSDGLVSPPDWHRPSDARQPQPHACAQSLPHSRSAHESSVGGERKSIAQTCAEAKGASAQQLALVRRRAQRTAQRSLFSESGRHWAAQRPSLTDRLGSIAHEVRRRTRLLNEPTLAAVRRRKTRPPVCSAAHGLCVRVRTLRRGLPPAAA